MADMVIFILPDTGYCHNQLLLLAGLSEQFDKLFI